MTIFSLSHFFFPHDILTPLLSFFQQAIGPAGLPQLYTDILDFCAGKVVEAVRELLDCLEEADSNACLVHVRAIMCVFVCVRGVVMCCVFGEIYRCVGGCVWLWLCPCVWEVYA